MCTGQTPHLSISSLAQPRTAGPSDRPHRQLAPGLPPAAPRSPATLAGWGHSAPLQPARAEASDLKGAGPCRAVSLLSASCSACSLYFEVGGGDGVLYLLHRKRVFDLGDSDVPRTEFDEGLESPTTQMLALYIVFLLYFVLYIYIYSTEFDSPRCRQSEQAG